METLRLGFESELQLLAYATATATAMQDLSSVCDLHHSSWHRRLLNPLSEDRGPCVLIDASWVRYCWATMGNPILPLFRLKRQEASIGSSCCLCSSLGHSNDLDSILVQGASTCHGYGQKKEDSTELTYRISPWWTFYTSVVHLSQLMTHLIHYYEIKSIFR